MTNLPKVSRTEATSLAILKRQQVPMLWETCMLVADISFYYLVLLAYGAEALARIPALPRLRMVVDVQADLCHLLLSVSRQATGDLQV
jgi:hypothetical protein